MPLIPYRFFISLSFLFILKAGHAQLNGTSVTHVSKSRSVEDNSASCIGPNKEVYTAEADKSMLRFRKSSAAGSSSGKIIAPVKNAWHYTINGVEITGLPSIACDLGNGEFKGRIYVCWSDDKYLAPDRDVFLSYSDDAGDTWTEAILVTYRPNHKAQFAPRLVIDNNGYVNILYYDKQNSADDSLTDLYLAQSRNGGLKFDYYRVNEKPFKFVPDHFIALKTTDALQLSWTENDKRLHQVTINENNLSDYNRQNALREVEMPRTFVFSDSIKIDFNLKAKGPVSAVITKPTEPGFEKHIWKNKRCEKGNTSLLIDPRKEGLEKGNYILTLYYDSRNSYTWIIEE